MVLFGSHIAEPSVHSFLSVNSNLQINELRTLKYSDYVNEAFEVKSLLIMC